MRKNPRKPIRLACFDYSLQGVYFLTICANERKALFGRVMDAGETEEPEVQLNALGRIVERNIGIISTVYPMISVEKYVVMPNHVHLLLLVKDEYCSDSVRRDKMLIPKAIQSFKASVTRQYKPNGGPIWQARYFDHVVRSDDEFLRIWQYIANNPAQWAEDCYHTP